jgi:predicted nucleotidyltransferase
MIHLEERHLKIIKEILSQAPIKFYAFGSRVKGNHQKFSDLDLCFKDPVDPKIIRDIKFAFEDSNLPFKVDVLDYNKCDKRFIELIENSLVEI